MTPTDTRLTSLESLLDSMSDDELARAWARCMRKLRTRDLIRTANTPVGDYAERICCDRFDLTRMGFSEKSVDAVDNTGPLPDQGPTPDPREPQSPARRDPRHRQEEAFDTLLAVIFNEDLEVLEIWSIPHAVVSEALVPRTNSTRFVLTPAVQNDPRAPIVDRS